MSFNSRESSLADGQPVRLYQFSRGAIRWSYNSSDRDITYQNQIFRTVQGGITDNGIICSGDPQSDQFVITAPADLDVALLYKTRSPSGAIDLVVYDMHYGDAEAAVSWVGQIGDVDWPTVDSCRITCVSEDELMDQPGLIDTYCRTCTAVVGDHRCKVNLVPYRVTLTPQSISGWVISSGVVAGYADGWFTGAMSSGKWTATTTIAATSSGTPDPIFTSWAAPRAFRQVANCGFIRVATGSRRPATTNSATSPTSGV